MMCHPIGKAGEKMENQKEKEKEIHFDGKINAAIRKRIQNKRLQLGMPYQRIASLFAANWSTIRKWETGPTETCSVAFRPILEDFLNGKYDKILRKQQSDPLTGNYPQCLPENALRCMEKFGHAYHLLRYRPELRENLLTNVDKITRNALQEMLTTEKKPKKNREPENDDE
jgi:DNA-binding transcriptional regulator YiaG